MIAAATVEPPASRTRMITGNQLRAARALLGWTIVELAAKSGISHVTISRAERTDGIPQVRTDSLAAIEIALRTAGIVFLDAGDTRSGGPGVRLRE